MRFGSVCSGIEAASVAWEPLGWKAAWFSEIEKFPSSVLAHHYPDTPNLGDMTALPDRILSGEIEAPEIFCGGTPCQAFSVAGLRQSLNDDRGNLSLTFVGIANAIDHVRSVRGDSSAIIFWENVPGVLNTKDNAFGCFIGALAGEVDPVTCPNGKWSTAGVVVGQKRAVAWRVLDAQYFGVAQRRRRVFVVASARADFDPAAILFEFEGVRRDIAPSREARQSVAPTIGASVGDVSRDNIGDSVVAFDTTQVTSAANYSNPKPGDPCHPLAAGAHAPAIAFGTDVYNGNITGDIASTIAGCSNGGGSNGPGRDVDSCESLRIVRPVYEMHGQDSRVRDLGDVCSTVTSKYGTGGGNVPVTIAVGTNCYNGNLTGDIAATMGTPGSSINASGPTVMVPQPISIHPHCIGRAPEAGPQGKEYLLDGSAYCMDSRGQPQAVAFQVGPQSGEFTDIAPTMDCRAKNGPIQNQLGAGVLQLVAFDGYNQTISATCQTIRADKTDGDHVGMVLHHMQVRRLTPVECERLQGFPDNYTNIKDKCPDGPRYKALGNSWAVPVVRWIGKRIQEHINAS
jgi:DNA (cytosine-5)-methyltransferase 1